MGDGHGASVLTGRSLSCTIGTPWRFQSICVCVCAVVQEAEAAAAASAAELADIRAKATFILNHLEPKVSLQQPVWVVHASPSLPGPLELLKGAA